METAGIIVLFLLIAGFLLVWFLHIEETTVATHEVDKNVEYDFDYDDETGEVIDLTESRRSPYLDDDEDNERLVRIDSLGYDYDLGYDRVDLTEFDKPRA